MKTNSFAKNRTGGGQTVPNNQPTTGLLSRAEIARRLGVCVHTVARNKQLTPIKFNARLVRYRAEDVERFIQTATVGGKERSQ